MEKVMVLDFGGQYTQLIARRIREAHVYCEILPYDQPASHWDGPDVRGIVLAGGPNSVNDAQAPRCDTAVFSLGKPVLGICYGAQLMAVQLGGQVGQPEVGEYGGVSIQLDTACPLFQGIPAGSRAWMSHHDAVLTLPAGFRPVAHTAGCANAALSGPDGHLFGVQFHPEVEHTPFGRQMLANFLFEVCHCRGDWILADLADRMIGDIRAQVGAGRVISGLSGGVDSAVASVLVHKAVGDQLTCVFVDHGLLRQGEAQEVLKTYRDGMGMNLVFVDCKQRFLSKLAGVSDPEAKRKIIGEEFIRVFEEEAAKLGQVDFLTQGTIYPDVIESGGVGGKAQVIKSHHNVGGLPKETRFKGLIEPLRQLFKDEVRALGTELGIPEEQVWRQPFPGPGLAVRVLGDVTEDKLDILRASDAILRQEVAEAGLSRAIWQYFTVFTGMRTVGVMGDERTYDYIIGIRAVTSTDAMTVDVAEIPYPVLKRISSRIVGEVPHVNRVVYDITSKPPGTIEWE